VTEPDATSGDETGFDRILAFTLPDRNARGRAVRLGPVLETILSAHAYPSGIRRVLAEALVLTALIGSLLKDDDSQLTLQAQADDGVVELLACDYRNGELRGYLRHDPARLDLLGPRPSLKTLFGDGYLAITFDLAASGQRYQGIVPLEGDSLAAACEAYFARSEQVPTLIRIAVADEGEHCVAGGFLLQHLAEGEDGRARLHVRMDHPEWEHVFTLAASIEKAELADSTLSLETLVWRLFHEERQIRIEPRAAMSRGCRCTAAHYRQVLARFPQEDLASMRGEDGLITVDCEFCSRKFPLDL
jgi:molecular chaperone Hsp33